MAQKNVSMENIASALEKLHKNPYIPQNMVDFLQAVVTIQADTTISLPELDIIKTTREEFLAGIPLFSCKQFVYDKEATAKLFGKLLAMLASDEKYTTTIASLRLALEKGEFSLEKAYHAFLRADTSFFEEWNTRLESTGNALLFLIQSSIMPSLQAVASKIITEHSIEGWQLQSCPCCGSDAFIAYWKNAVGEQYNVCSFCHTEYRVPRMHCAYCEEDKHTHLAYISAEEMPLLQMQTCETCKQYIKIIDARESSVHTMPAIDDVDTVMIDVLGQQKGFTRPVLSSWGF